MNKIKKDEKYIKGILAKVFKDVGNFRQFEFTAFGGAYRPDFVILKDDSFIYFEIKSEFDDFSRLQSQIDEARGMFTEVFLVIPTSKFKYFIKNDFDCGVYLLEDLEKGSKKPHTKQNYCRGLSISKISSLLWGNELRSYIKEKMPNMYAVDSSDGQKRTLTRMTIDQLQKAFELFYSNRDCLKILNEILPNRDYNFRRYNEQFKLSQ